VRPAQTAGVIQAAHFIQAAPFKEPMKTLQVCLTQTDDLTSDLPQILAISPQLLLVFGAVDFFARGNLGAQLRAAFPEAIIAGCSTAGEIAGQRVYDNHCIVTAIHFDHTRLAAVTTPLVSMADSFAAGARLSHALTQDQLRGVLLLGTGVAINGSALVAGMQGSLAPGVNISGGLAADAGAFQQTWTLGPAGSTCDHQVAVGFYGDHIRMSYGTFAGWEAFGPARKITRCEGNVLYELDGKSALEVYKRYLGDYARDLPGSGLLFPFEMLGSGHEKRGIFRTILAVDEAQGALVLAGDIDPDGYLKLMHSSTDKLIAGADTAAKTARQRHRCQPDQSLALLVSCIGRKLVMGDRTDEEVEAVAEVLGQDVTITGYYSNGEIANTNLQGDCRLHNQTMTITWISEHH
jgi:hypothetical protein